MISLYGEHALNAIFFNLVSFLKGHMADKYYVDFPSSWFTEAKDPENTPCEIGRDSLGD